MTQRRALHWRPVAIPALIIGVILTGAALRVRPDTAAVGMVVWTVSLWIAGAGITWRTIRQATAGHFATDLVATLAIIAAILLGQPLAGLIVVLMQTGGEALERHARGRASRALHALEEEAPRIAHRVQDGAITDIPVDAVARGDMLLIRPGEMVPCDGIVVDGYSHVDTSRLTGEPVPVRVEPGASVASGATNQEGSISVRATALAAESQYARIVELVRAAQASKAPLQRLADRYAVWFTPITLVTCAIAYALTRDPLRVLAILVVATPCPLILATPVARLGGVNAAARRQIIVRTGGALEALAHTTAAVFDKTGTLTIGMPRVSRVIPATGFGEIELIRLAAAVEQGSGHHLARTVVEAAKEAGVRLPSAHVTETPGRGVAGSIGPTHILVGSRSFILEQHPDAASGIAALDSVTDGLRAWVGVNGRVAGVIEFADTLRPGARETVDQLRALGITRLLVRSGDAASHTRAVADAVGIDDVRGDLLPEHKVEAIHALVAEGERVAMIGDGTNDAPALGTATVGIALAGHGGGITAEAADVVVLADDLSRVPTAIRIARRTLRIARQSIWVGLGLSGVAMAFAAAGMIPPITGALLQEAIDVAVIVNALRASRTPGSAGSQPLPSDAGRMTSRYQDIQGAPNRQQGFLTRDTRTSAEIAERLEPAGQRGQGRRASGKGGPG